MAGDRAGRRRIGPSGRAGFPFSIVQETTFGSASNATSFTVTFPQTAATGGNTLWLFVATDDQTITTPSGWTTDINQVQSTNSKVLVLHKLADGDTSATFTTSSGTSYAGYFMEMIGSHYIDRSASAGIANAMPFSLPALTPSAGAALFSIACLVNSGTPAAPVFNQQPINPAWRQISATGTTTNSRQLVGYAYTGSTAPGKITPPQVNIPGYAFFAGGGIASSTFSIL